MPRDIPEDAQAALRRGDKREAVRLVQVAHGLGLLEAKTLIETMAAAPDARSGSQALPDTVMATLRSGGVVQAVRELRDIEGLDLRTATERVDAALLEMGRPGIEGVRRPGESPVDAAERPAAVVARDRRTGPLLAIVAVVAAFAAAAWFLTR